MSWTLAKLSEVCEINIGKTPARATSAYWGNGNPWLSIRDMNQGMLLSETKEEITNLGVKESNIKLVPKGTVLFSFKLSIGKIGITQRAMYTNEAIAALPIKDKKILCEEYLVYALSKMDAGKTSDRAVMGATLNKKKLAELKIPLPPLKEQKRIAAILDKADAIRHKRQQAIGLTDQFLRSVFLDMFGDPVTNPKGWDVTDVNSISLKVTDGEHSTPKRSDEGVKLLSARNVRDGFIDWVNVSVDFVPKEEYEKLRKRCEPLRGDILISCSGSIGRVTLVNTDEPLVMVRSAALVKPDHDQINNVFMENYLRTDYMRALMNKRAKSSSQANLFIGPIKELPVFLPPYELQIKFAKYVKKIKEKSIKHKDAVLASEKMFLSITQSAFRGELSKQNKAA